MATYTDDLEGFADDDYLGSSADWNITRDGGNGGGSMRIDTHDHNSTLVCDMSNSSNEVWGIYNSLMDTDEHEVEIIGLPDSDVNHRNEIEVVLQCESASPSWDTIDCYTAGLRGIDGTFDLAAEIVRWDNGSPTVIATTTLTGYKSSSTVYTIRGRVQSGVVKLFIDDVEELSVSDSTHAGNKAVGVMMIRHISATNSQPWWDDFAASDLAAGTFDGSYVYHSGSKVRARTASGGKMSLRDAAGSRWEV